MSQLVLGSVVQCLVGRIEGVTAVIVVRRIGGVQAELDQEAEAEIDVIPPPVLRCRVPVRILGLL